MTDHRTRTAERAAIDGDPQAAARALQAHLRATAGPWQRCRDCGGDGGRNVWGGDAYTAMPVFAHCPACSGTGRVRMDYEDRVALLAYVGDAGARELAGTVRPGGWRYPVTFPDEGPLLDEWPLEGWLASLVDGWPGAFLRAACAAARVVLKRDEPTARASGTLAYAFDDARQAVEAAEAYRDCPCEAHLQACRERIWFRGSTLYSDYVVVRGEPWQALLLAACNSAPVRRPVNAAECVAECVRMTSEPAVRAAICADLRGWVLGYASGVRAPG